MKRRWFQIHLSTAVVLMLTAGVLLWANLRSRFQDLGLPKNFKVSGWPSVAFVHGDAFVSIHKLHSPSRKSWPPKWKFGWKVDGVVMNFLNAVTVLLVVSIL